MLGGTLSGLRFQPHPETVGLRISIIYLAEVSAFDMSLPKDSKESGYPGLGAGCQFVADPSASFCSSLFPLALKAFVSRELSGSELWYFCLEQPLPSVQVSGKASGV